MKNGFLLLLLVMLVVMPASAQDAAPADLEHEHILISWPPPVTEVWGVGDVIGTADIEGMLYYYLEYKALNDDLTIPENGPWVPVTPAISEPVVNDTLATLDTTTVPDGMYALRLTVNTETDSYHYVVTPLRISNARFEAVTRRIEDAALDRVEADDPNDEAQIEEARPTPQPTVAPPADSAPRVTPSGVAVNVRRCAIVDNDRCPSVASLNPGAFGRVIGINRAQSWLHIVLPSGVQGWVARIVVTESGDFASVPVQTPPQPLAPRPVQPTVPPANVGQPVPNGMSIEGGRAVCGEPFRVLINLGNFGLTSPAGTLTLQDVNVRTGQTTYTGYGNYPAMTQGQNFVVVITPTVTTYYDEEHELRAFAAGHQFTLRYTLEQGTCGVSSAPATPSGTQRNFSSGECNLVINGTGEVYNRAGGEVIAPLAGGTYPALQVVRVGGTDWYQLALENNAPWLPAVPYVTRQGNCSP